MQGQEETHASVLTHRPDGGGARSIAVNPCFQVPVVVEGHLGVIGNSQKTQVEGKAKGQITTEEHRKHQNVEENAWCKQKTGQNLHEKGAPIRVWIFKDCHDLCNIR